MRRSIIFGLALITATALAGAAGARPPGDERDTPAPPAACDDTRASRDRPDCPAETGVIDHLPDSFFVGGGGVGPQFIEGGGGAHVWVQTAAGASVSASAYAAASVRVSAGARAHGRW